MAVEGFYLPDPPQSLIDGFGGCIDDYRPTVQIPACILPAFQFFQRVSTQWRAGPGGIFGLDYVAVDTLARIYKVDLSASMMDDIAIMESSAIEIINGE